MNRLPQIAALAALALTAAACGGSSPSVTDGASELATTSREPRPGVDDSILTATRAGSITVDGQTTTFDGTEIDFEFDLGEPTPAALGYAGAGGEDGLVIVPIDLEKEVPTGAVLYFDGENVAEETSAADFIEAGEDGFSATGTFDSGRVFALDIGIGTGSSTFELDGNRAVVRGDLGSTTFDQMTHLIENHPEVDTLLLQDVPGSVNDEINVQTGRLIREAGFTTIIPSDGLAASGGVDLFAAGVERIAEAGAQVGIHSWCCTDDNTPAADLPRDDPQHADQLDYFTMMLGADLGPEFYFQTLNAAPFDGIHFMTDAELDASTITTNR